MIVLPQFVTAFAHILNFGHPCLTVTSYRTKPNSIGLLCLGSEAGSVRPSNRIMVELIKLIR